MKTIPKEIKELIDHWDKRRHSYCEAGSSRDRLAIQDLGKLIDWVKENKSSTLDEGAVRKILEDWEVTYAPKPHLKAKFPEVMKNPKIKEDFIKAICNLSRRGEMKIKYKHSIL